MCRKVTWAELAVKVTFMVGIQNGAPEYKNKYKADDRNDTRHLSTYLS